MSKVWANVIGTGARDDMFRPDVDGAFGDDHHHPPAEIPVDIDPASPNYGKPLVKRCRVVCTPAEAKAIRDARKDVKPRDVSAEDMALVELTDLAPKSDPDSPHFDSAPARDKLRAAFARLQDQTVRRRMLLQAVRRGLSVPDAETIAVEHGMTD